MNEYEPVASASVEKFVETMTKELFVDFARLREMFSVTSPNELPEDDYNVLSVFEKQEKWRTLVDQRALIVGTSLAEEEASFLKTTFFTLMGFTDKVYVSEVLTWLIQDEKRVSKMGLDNLAHRMQTKMQELMNIINEE